MEIVSKSNNFESNQFIINNIKEKPNKETLWEKIFGNKAFIILMFSLFLPSALQQLVTTAVTYVDTFFIAGFAPGNSGAIAKTAVGVSTSIINFPLMVVLGITSGIGIVTAQYFGANDKNKLQQTIIYKIIVSFVITIPFIVLMMSIPNQLVSVTRNVFDPAEDSADYKITSAASTYLFWSGPSFIFIILVYTLGYSYREVGKPKFALIAAVCSMCANIIMDPLLIIFENDLNNAIRNIALSTTASRFIEFTVMFLFIYLKKDKWLMITRIKLEWNVFVVTIKNSWQAILNDTLYGFATLFLVICLLVYSSKTHDAFTTVSIIVQFASVIFPGMAASCAVLVGSELGKNDIKQAKTNSIHLIVWGSIITFGFAVILFILSWFINPILSPQPSDPAQYENWKLNQTVAQQAEWIMMPVIFSQGLFSILYYSIKAGGSKYIFFTDGFIMSLWCIIFGSLVYTKVINRDNISPQLMFFFIEFNQIAKALLSFCFYKWSNWAINITDNKAKVSKPKINKIRSSRYS